MITEHSCIKKILILQFFSGGSLFENIKQKTASTNDLLTKYSSITFEKDTSDLPDRDVDDMYSDSSECSYSDLITDYNSKRTIQKNDEKPENSDTEEVSANSAASLSETKENSDELTTETKNGSNEKIEITFQRSMSEKSYTEEFTMINYIPPLTDIIKWAAQLLLAIDKLHRVGIVIWYLILNFNDKANLI